MRLKSAIRFCPRARELSRPALVAAALLLSGSLVAAEEATPEPSSATKASASEKLSLDQVEVAAKFAKLERTLLDMATRSAVSDPKRAALLRKAVAQSKEKLIALQMKRLADELKQDKLAAAVTDQQAVEEDLQKLLELLLTEQRGDRLKDERERVKAQLRKIKELINKQIELQAKTSDASKPAELAPTQGKLAEDADRLAKEMQPSPGAKSDSKSPAKGDEGKNKPGDEKSDSKSPKKSADEKGDKRPGEKSSKSEAPDKPSDGKDSEAKPSEGKPSDTKPSDTKPSDKKPSKGQPKSGKPSDQPPGEQAEAENSEDQPPPEADTPGRKRVAAAQQKMESAQKKLEKAEREGAEKDQEEAVRELDQARAELEEILRQLRDEEVERVLAQLETRFRVMRQMQQEVYEGTKRVDSVPQEKRTRNDEIEAGRLSRRESMIVVEADKALIVLREEGTAVAMPEAVEQMRDDMNQVVARLGQAKVDSVTQAIEEEILAGLDEMIASLQQAQRDKQDGKQRQGQPGEPQDPPLVDRLAELKMLRSLQMRVNLRTQRYSKLIGGDTGQSDAPELLDALQRLAEREERIYRATRDIVLGKNQ